MPTRALPFVRDRQYVSEYQFYHIVVISIASDHTPEEDCLGIESFTEANLVQSSLPVSWPMRHDK